MSPNNRNSSIGGGGAGGPNDLFEIHINNSPDPPDDDDEVHEPQDYTGDYGLDENEENGDE